MAKISVKIRNDIGDPGEHRKYGRLEPGKTISIDEEDFGSELFERPEGFISPHEKADQERAAAEGRTIGKHDPPAPVADQPAPGGKQSKGGDK